MGQAEVSVDIENGRLLGVLTAAGVAEFRGIPYAERPDQWDAPQPAKNEGEIDATHFGAAPPQPGIHAADTGPGSYLTLTVRAPWPPTEPRPVLVWLCVGGNIAGRANAAPYLESTLVESGIVTVTVAARLGAAGFTVVDDAPDNRAAMDWVAALGWVHDRIAVLGGDPGAITVAGQSAGGGAVTALLARPESGGLFHRAIVMSSALPSTSRPVAARRAQQLAQLLGVEASAPAIASVPYERLMAAIAETFGPRWRVDDPVVRVRNMVEGPPFRLVDDAALGLGPVLAAMRSGAGSGIPLLIGSTHDEFTESFAAMSNRLNTVTLAAAFDEIAPGGSRHLAGYRRALPEAGPGMLLGRAFTDAVFRSTPSRIAEARRLGSGGRAPTFVYETGPFARGSAAHGVDVPAVFQGGKAPGLAGPVVSAQIQNAWIRFIRTGSADWDPSGTAETVRRFDDGPGAANARDELDEILSVWHRT